LVLVLLVACGKESDPQPAPDRAAAPSVPPPSLDLLPSDRRTSWSPGLPGGIPERKTVCATVTASAFGNGSVDATPAIQAAIDSCPVGQVVVLSAGSFRIGNGPIRINKGVVLRGAGPARTHLAAPDGTNQALVVIGQQWPKVDQSVDLVASAVKGSTSATVSRISDLAVGELVLIDALTDESTTRWSATSAPGDPSREWFSRRDRPVSQVMEVARTSGNTRN
jgi:hypothetical protein